MVRAYDGPTVTPAAFAATPGGASGFGSIILYIQSVQSFLLEAPVGENQGEPQKITSSVAMTMLLATAVQQYIIYYCCCVFGVEQQF